MQGIFDSIGSIWELTRSVASCKSSAREGCSLSMSDRDCRTGLLTDLAKWNIHTSVPNSLTAVGDCGTFSSDLHQLDGNQARNSSVQSYAELF